MHDNRTAIAASMCSYSESLSPPHPTHAPTHTASPVFTGLPSIVKNPLTPARHHGQGGGFDSLPAKGDRDTLSPNADTHSHARFPAADGEGDGENARVAPAEVLCPASRLLANDASESS